MAAFLYGIQRVSVEKVTLHADYFQLVVLMLFPTEEKVSALAQLAFDIDKGSEAKRIAYCCDPLQLSFSSKLLCRTQHEIADMEAPSSM